MMLSVKHKGYFRKSLVYLFLVVGFLGQVLAQIPDTPEKPKLQTAVYDEVGLLDAVQKSSLEQKLIQYADSTSTQIVIVAVGTTNTQDIGYYATEWAHKWGVGQADKDNGVIILIAKDDRKMTIRTGYGVEHLLTDALSRKIIENVLSPHFRQGDFYGGLDEATDVMFDIFAGEYKEEDVAQEGSIWPIIIFLLIVIIFIWLIAKASKNSGGNKGGGRRLLEDDFFGPIILSSGGRSSGWGSSGGGWSTGGGFGSGGFGGGFGGGGFGGGGASGGW